MSEPGPAARLGAFAGRFWRLNLVNRTALVACALWAVLVLSYAAGYFGGTAGGGARGTAFLDAVFFLIALLLPVGLVGLAAALAAELARQRAAVATLTEAAGPLAAALAEARPAVSPLGEADLERAVRRAIRDGQAELATALHELRGGQARLEGALARSGAPRPAPETVPARPPAPTPPEEPTLPIAAPTTDAPLACDELIRALDFPRDASDAEGFRALKRALRHHSLAQMLQAAEDVLNLLSQEGVYTDDLRHEPGPASAWRAFIAGRRGDEVAAAGGIRDAGALEAARRLMKSDPIFRDTALFFQRRFDVVLQQFGRDASDEALLALADTRSGRAFMLCARVSGSFG